MATAQKNKSTGVNQNQPQRKSVINTGKINRWIYHYGYLFKGVPDGTPVSLLNGNNGAQEQQGSSE